MKHTRLLFACLAAAALTGCRHHFVNTVENADKAAPPHIIQDTRFITDERLNRCIALQHVNTARTPEGFLKVQLEAVDLRFNRRPYTFKYKFSWFDDQGMQVTTVLSDWTEKSVNPGEVFTIQSIAPTKNCADFKISLMDAHRRY